MKPEVGTHLKPKAIVFDYLRKCPEISVRAHACQLAVPAGFVRNIEAVVRGRLPTWKKIAEMGVHHFRQRDEQGPRCRGQSCMVCLSRVDGAGSAVSKGRVEGGEV